MSAVAEFKACACPSCRRLLNRTTEASPAPGAYTVCAYCAAALRFTADLELELVELEAIEPAHVAAAMRMTVDVARRRIKASRRHLN